MKKIITEQQEDKEGYIISTSINDKILIKIDHFKNIKKEDNFTLFWLGTIEKDKMQNFLKKIINDEYDRCVYFYFFKNEQKITPPLPLRKNGVLQFPDPIEKSIETTHGEPSFIRYELFKKNEEKPHVILWSNQEKEENNQQSGLYSTINFFTDQETEKLIISLIKNSLIETFNKKTISKALKQTLSNIHW